MKIVHIVAAYPPVVGGMERAVKELAERTAKLGHDVTVFTPAVNGIKDEISANGVKVYRLWAIDVPGIPITMPLLPFRLWGYINNNTIVHVHYILNFSMDIAILTAWIKRAKIVSHIRIDPEPSGRFGFLNPLYKKIVWGWILRRSNKIICHTPDYADIISRKYHVPINKFVVIPNGINTADFKRKNNFDILPPVKILFVGRLSKQKNIPRLVEAFRLFQQKYDSVLHIVGDGEERQEIECLINRNGINNVVLHGNLAGEKLANMYCDCDIFVLPSDYETFGNVNLEAMTSGLPVIASDIPGVHDLLVGAAILSKPSAENFAFAMEMLVNDTKLRLELIEKGFDRVKGYDWDNTVEKVITLYHMLFI
jgi:glycosyltransferase involved in cell wall biosynthesis